MATATLPDFKTPDGLVSGFYLSFEDDETFTGSPETIQWAYAIVERGDDMWNWPSVVADAEAYIAGNA